MRIFRPQLARLAISILLLSVGHALANEWAPAVPIGSILLPIEATDQDGNQWDNQKLLAANGLVMVFVRSTDW